MSDVVDYRQEKANGKIVYGSLPYKKLLAKIASTPIKDRCFYQIIKPGDRLLSLVFKHIYTPDEKDYAKSDNYEDDPRSGIGKDNGDSQSRIGTDNGGGRPERCVEIGEDLVERLSNFGVPITYNDLYIYTVYSPNNSYELIEFVLKSYRFSHQTCRLIEDKLRKEFENLVVDRLATIERLIIGCRERDREGFKRAEDHADSDESILTTSFLTTIRTALVVDLPNSESPQIRLSEAAFYDLAMLISKERYLSNRKKFLIAGKYINARYQDLLFEVLEKKGLAEIWDGKIWQSDDPRYGIWSYISEAFKDISGFIEWKTKHGIGMFPLMGVTFNTLKNRVAGLRENLISYDLTWAQFLGSLVYIEEGNYYLATSEDGLERYSEEELRALTENIVYHHDPGIYADDDEEVNMETTETLWEFIKKMRPAITYRRAIFFPATPYNTRIDPLDFNLFQGFGGLPREAGVGDFLWWFDEVSGGYKFTDCISRHIKNIRLHPDKKGRRIPLFIGYRASELATFFVDGVFGRRYAKKISSYSLESGKYAQGGWLFVAAEYSKKITPELLKQILIDGHPNGEGKDEWTNYFLFSEAMIHCDCDFIQPIYYHHRPCPVPLDDKLADALINYLEEVFGYQFEELEGIPLDANSIELFIKNFMWLDSVGNKITEATMATLYRYYRIFMNDNSLPVEHDKQFSNIVAKECEEVGRTKDARYYGPKR